jgi:hypothetical protein
MTLKAWRRVFVVAALSAQIHMTRTPQFAPTVDCAHNGPQVQLYAGEFLFLLSSALFLALVFEMSRELREKLLCTALLVFGVYHIVDAFFPVCPLPAGSIDLSEGFLQISYFCYFALAVLSIREIAGAASATRIAARSSN